MLLDQLPPVPFGPNYNLEFTGECLALAYLAGYNDQAIQPRVLTSLKNAYAMDDIVLRAFVPGGRPGYAITKWVNENRQSVTVSIEGLRVWSQLRNWWSGFGSQSFLSGRGVAFAQFYNFAVAIRDELLATTDFNTLWNAPGSTFTFTGHSMGAAVAEILAELMKVNNPRRVIKLVKFGSPRVGDANYVRSLSRGVFRESWYYGRDPVDILPYYSPSSFSMSTTNTMVGFTWYAQDSNATRIDPTGHYLDPFHVGGAVQSGQYLRSFGLPVNVNSPWFDHTIKAYRFGFMVYNNWYNGLGLWRFRYLEFNDENQWGLQFNNQSAFTDLMQALVTPQPDPVRVDCPEWTALRDGNGNASLRDRPRLPIQSFDEPQWGAQNDGSWGDPVQPEVAPVSAIVAPAPRVFSRVTPGRRRG